MGRELKYSVLDVFAERVLEGNPLAVFHDARTLSEEEMQALARETNLAETTFVLPDDPETELREGVRVRIFTTQEELPFAGHPTLGTATWLYLNHPVLRGAEAVTLRLNVGPITVRFTAAGDGGSGVQGMMRQNDPVFGKVHDRAAVAQALGLRKDDVSAEYLPQTVSTGLPFCIVLLASLEAAAHVQVSQRDAQAVLDGDDAKFFYCVAPAATQESTGGPHWHARMQFYGGEDPATGSAAGCCVAWLVKHGLAASGEPVVIEQGIEIRRPSRITVQASGVAFGVASGDAYGAAAEVNEVMVSGRTIAVAEGRFFLP